MGGGLSELFDVLFGGGQRRGAGSRFAARGADVESEIMPPLQEAHRGDSRRLSVPLEEECPACGGTGLREKKSCTACGGSGVSMRIERITVHIPAGERDGSVTRVPGRGGAGLAGVERGDLYFHIRLLPHETFELRDGADVRVEVPVAPWEAPLGARVEVPMRDGPVQMRLPPNSQGADVAAAGERAGQAGRPLFARSAVERLRSIIRLRRDLGVNPAGIAVILEMEDRIRAREEQLERLRRGEATR